MTGRPEEDLVLDDGGEHQLPDYQPGLAGYLMRGSFLIGATALLIAMAADAIAVIGRHTGLPLLGSIEIVQACVVIAASSAMVGATLNKTHAEVHILTERLPEGARVLLKRLSDLCSGVFVVVLLVGSVWLVAELWNGHERTENLHIPLKGLRLIWCASAALMAAIFLARVVARRKPDAAHVA